MDEFMQRWQYVRSETLEILGTLNDEQLQFTPPGEKWQPLYHQFGCMGRTQLVYAEAALSGTMDSSLFDSSSLPSKDRYQTTDSIRTFLRSTEDEWERTVGDNTRGVQWLDGKKAIALHVACLAEHERLHHGQLITYFTLAGFELPAAFKANWAL